MGKKEKKIKIKWKELTIKQKIGRVFKNIGKGIGIFTLICCVLGCITLGVIYYKLKPTINTAKKTAYDKLASIDSNTFTMLGDTEIFDKDGNSLGKVTASNYKYVKVSEVAQYVQDGYIAVEDRRFLSHGGIDLKSLVRAGVAYVKNKGAITQGGSTITQQVIKNVLLSQDQTFSRKFTEMMIAPEFEKLYTKSQIMEFYLNSNYYGEGCYGIESASKYYFSKSAKDLTLSESATLVGVSNNPSMYAPVYDITASKEKRNLVLSQMLEVGAITQEEYDKAKSEEIVLKISTLEKQDETYMQSYAIHCTTLQLMKNDGFKFRYVFSDYDDYNAYCKEYNASYLSLASEIRAGGYTIHTSLDSKKQEALQNAVDNSLKGFTEVDAVTGKLTMQGGAVSVNNETGYVEAIVGGRGTKDQYNRGFLAERQPGSSIKPLVAYAPAFETGNYYPSYVMTDKAVESGVQNYSKNYMGDVTLREALSRSLNTIPYRLLADVTPEKGLSYLDKMRFTSLLPDDKNPIIAVGGFTSGVTIVDMAKAYSTLVSGGVYSANDCIMKIEFLNDGVIYEGEYDKVRVYNEDCAYMTVDMLKGVLNDKYGTGRAFKLSNMTAGAKTGTTDNYKDIWFCGVTPYDSVSVWCGYDTPKQVDAFINHSYAGDIWKSYMDTINKGKENKDFKKPTTIVEKYVDNNGNISKNNTSKKDIFSGTLIQAREDKEIERQKQLMKAKAEEWAKGEEARIKNASNLVAEYENMHCNSVSDLTTVKNKYKEALDVVNTLSTLEKKKALLDKLDIWKAVVDKECEVYEKILADQEETERAEARKQAEKQAEYEKENAKILEEARAEGKSQAEGNVVSKAESALNTLKGVSKDDNRKYYYYGLAETLVNNCSSYSKYSNLVSQLESEKVRLGIDLSKAQSNVAP